MPTWSRSEATRRCTGVRRKNPLLSAKTKSRSQGLLFALAKINKGIRTRREQTCLRKKTVRWTVLADVVKEQSDAKVHRSAPKKSLALRHKSTVILIELRRAFSMPENRLKSRLLPFLSINEPRHRAFLQWGFVRFTVVSA